MAAKRGQKRRGGALVVILATFFPDTHLQRIPLGCDTLYYYLLPVMTLTPKKTG